MPDIAINVAIDTSVLVLDYEPAAHTQLTALNPAAGAAWDTLVAAVGALSLEPLFGSVPNGTLADLLDAGRIAGNDPPDLLAWFEVVIDDGLAATVLSGLQSLFFVAQAELRPRAQVASVITWNTNPEAVRSIAIEPGVTGGVDAKYAWQVDGGTGERITIGDIEHGWDLTHEDLTAAQIIKAPAGPEKDVDHGTGVAGILVAPDNGKGIVGIVPAARMLLFNSIGAGRPESVAAALILAMASLSAGQGDVVLIELGIPFSSAAGGDIPVEVDTAVLRAIQALTAVGITVIEPAGNGAVDLDAQPALARMNPANAQFVDSGAIMVGAGSVSAAGTPQRASFSTFGTRVDCFAVATAIRAPTTAPSSYGLFSGTSGASAAIAGVAAAVQAMSFAHTGQFFAPADLRAILRNPALAPPVVPPPPGRIGGNPDLKLIAQSFRWARILPPAVVSADASTLFLVAIDAEGHLSRRDFVKGAGWTAPVVDDPTFFFLGQTPALTVSTGAAGIRFDAYTADAGERLHHQSWDGATLVTGTLVTARTPNDTITTDRALAATPIGPNATKVAGIDHDGLLTVMTGDPSTQFAPPVDVLGLDPTATFRQSAGPAIVSRATNQADLVAVDDTATLRFTHFDATLPGTGWILPTVPVPGALCHSKARPAITGDLTSLAAIAVDVDGNLCATQAGLTPVPILSPLAVIDPSLVRVSRVGPAAIVLTDGDQLVALAVGEDLFLRFSLKRVSAAVWAPLAVVDPDVICSPLGGVSAVAFGPSGVAAVVVGIDGEPLSASWTAAAGWTALRPAAP